MWVMRLLPDRFEPCPFLQAPSVPKPEAFSFWGGSPVAAGMSRERGPADCTDFAPFAALFARVFA
jgi:hypothetical protein